MLTALLEGQAGNVTVVFPPRRRGPVVIVTIEVSTAEDFSQEFCRSINLSPAQADLDVAELRAALEEMVAQNADATVTVLLFGETIIRADLLLGLEDPMLEALLAGQPVSVSGNFREERLEIVGIALPEEGRNRNHRSVHQSPSPVTSRTINRAVMSRMTSRR